MTDVEVLAAREFEVRLHRGCPSDSRMGLTRVGDSTAGWLHAPTMDRVFPDRLERQYWGRENDQQSRQYLFLDEGRYWIADGAGPYSTPQR